MKLLVISVACFVGAAIGLYLYAAYDVQNVFADWEESYS